ncbi:MAG: single-stranded DNA-binding protein, partial [Bacteroidales bacterium]|nr:single-stranded DNA-binding protein [Bacteroidales bacterium]
GSKVANFSLATETYYKTRDGHAISETTWHNIVAWEGKETMDVERISKGMAIYVTGRLRASKYTTTEGTEKQFYEVLANKVRILEDEPSVEM